VNDLAVQLVGGAGFATSITMFIPYARSVWHHRHDPQALEAISGASQWLLAANASSGLFTPL